MSSIGSAGCNYAGNMTSHSGDTTSYTFTYDADGQRVVRETVTDTIVYVGSHYELRFEKQDMDEDLDGDCLVTAGSSGSRPIKRRTDRNGNPYHVVRGGNWYNGEYGHSRVANRSKGSSPALNVPCG
jgi:YD repeat-containing protein